MHIVYLISNLQFGGAQNITVGLAEEAKMCGYRASIITICEGNDYGDRLKEYGIEFYSLSYEGSFKPVNIFSIISLRFGLKELLHTIKPDIIHSHLFIPQLILYGIASVNGVPMVVTYHDNNPWWHKKSLYSILQKHIEKTFALKTAKYAAAISQSVQSDVLKNLHMKPEKCPVIYNFMETPAIENMSDRSSRRQNKILMVTRLDINKKGLDTALKVLSRLTEKNSDVKMIVVGSGPNEKQFLTMVEDLNLGECIEFRGYRCDVYAQYKDADIVLMPSRWEGFGITAAEAAIMGIPVVASRVGGLQEVVIHGETGFTCDPENVDMFVHYVNTLFTDGELYSKISGNAILKAKERFSRERSFIEYRKLYMGAIAEAEAEVNG